MNNQRNKRLAVLGAILLGILLIAFTAYNQLVFHIVKTDPGMSAVSQYSPFVRIYFNNDIDAGSLKITDFGGLFESKSVKGKVVELNFARLLTPNKEYAFSIAHVENTRGGVIENKEFRFFAKNIPIAKLSKDQQAAILARQDQIPYSVYSIDYSGFDALTEQGISAGQLLDIKTALFDYSQQASKEYPTMNLDPNSLRIVLHDPSARVSNANSATFTVSLGGAAFSVRSEYNGLEDNTFTRIYDPSGAQVFDNTAR
jgi:hypothetical protein